MSKPLLCSFQNELTLLWLLFVDLNNGLATLATLCTSSNMDQPQLTSDFQCRRRKKSGLNENKKLLEKRLAQYPKFWPQKYKLFTPALSLLGEYCLLLSFTFTYFLCSFQNGSSPLSGCLIFVPLPFSMLTIVSFYYY